MKPLLVNVLLVILVCSAACVLGLVVPGVASLHFERKGQRARDRGIAIQERTES